MEDKQSNENNTNTIEENKVSQENTSKEKRVIEQSVGKLEDEKTFGVDIGLDWKDGREVSFILKQDKFLDNFIDRFGKGLIEKMQNVQNDDKTNSEFDEILSTLPIYPCPIFKSKLILALDYILGDMNIKESSPLDSSFRIFKKLMRAEKLIYLHSTKKKLEEKQKIQKTRTNIFNSIVGKLFLAYTKLAFLPIGQNSTVTNYLMENFYNNLNVIRIWEFTILDYLDVPKKFQGNFITSEASIIPNDISLFRNTASSVLDDTKLLFEKLSTSQYVETKVSWESICPKDMDPPEWIYKKSSSFVLFHLKYAKELKKDDKFSCGRQKCNKVEHTKREFKQCSKCHWTRYCSRECQVGDWNEKHKLNCFKERSTDYFSKGRLVIGPDV